MIGKITIGTSFPATVSYVMKQQSRILDHAGITPPYIRNMAQDFKDQTLLNPRVKHTVGHIALSFSAHDKDKLTDRKMAEIAKEYMERMGIRDTQYLLVRHLDQAHPHCHLVYNRIGNHGQTIPDKNMKIRNGKICKELTAKYGLYYAPGKDEVTATGCGNRTERNTGFTMRSAPACPVVRREMSWKNGCKNKASRSVTNSTGTPTKSRASCSA